MSYRSGSILSAALMLALISVLMLGLGIASGAGFEKEWAKLLKKAQEEGEVVAFICCGVGRNLATSSIILLASRVP